MGEAPVVGIDPGLSGAVAILWPDGAVEVSDMPVMRAGAKGKKTIDLVNLRALLAEAALAWGGRVVVEAQQPMPKQGLGSTFATGYGYGVLLGMLHALQVRHCTVRPQEWKRALGLGQGKDAARAKASQLHPQESQYWRAASHHNRAEAVLLADYGLTRVWPTPESRCVAADGARGD